MCLGFKRVSTSKSSREDDWFKFETNLSYSRCSRSSQTQEEISRVYKLWPSVQLLRIICHSHLRPCRRPEPHPMPGRRPRPTPQQVRGRWNIPRVWKSRVTSLTFTRIWVAAQGRHCGNCALGLSLEALSKPADSHCCLASDSWRIVIKHLMSFNNWCSLGLSSDTTSLKSNNIVWWLIYLSRVTSITIVVKNTVPKLFYMYIFV